MSRLLMYFGWALLVGGGLVILGSLVLGPGEGELLLKVIPLGVALTIAGQFLTQARIGIDAEEKKSKYYLDACVDAYNQAAELLNDGNNDRSTWIAAARALVHARELEVNVSTDFHQRVLELNRLKYRGVFGGVLDRSACFFYGVDNEDTPIDEAAAQSTARTTRAGRTVTSSVRYLSEKALRAVWEAAQWPQDFDDPLTESFSLKERERLIVLYPGLHEYLKHQDHWHSASGRLFPRNNNEER